MLTRDELMREAAASGFQPEPFEEAIHLLELLESLARHPFLGRRLALKGGTALNLFLLDVPRLSVDIDLNYVGAADREAMLVERPKVENAIQAVCGRLGLQVRRVPSEHAGGKWRLSFLGVFGSPSTLELDINFIHRVPLWPLAVMDSRPVGESRARGVRVLDVHELSAGKLCALFDRRASRDVFDTHQLHQIGGLDWKRVRLAFVVLGGASRRDWRTLAADDIRVDEDELARMLKPVLRADQTMSRDADPNWAQRLVDDCQTLATKLLPFNDAELEFLDRLNDDGEILPQLLSEKQEMHEIIRSHPGLRWKALNVRQHRSKNGD